MVIPIEIFLSHSDKDKKIARNLADELSNFGLKIFVAHDDIQVGDHWETTLIEKIRHCDLFLVLLSANFHNSQYTDHEVGIAYGLNKSIVPVRIDETIPYGFMSKFQAKKISVDIDKNEIAKFFYTVVSKNETGMKMLNNLIEEFCKSQSFIAANRVTSLLSQYPNFSDEQIHKIIESYISNDQISQAFKSRKWCKILIAKNWEKLDKNLCSKIKNFEEE
jgi:hypothetical protein